MNEKSRPPPGAGFPERIQRVRCGKLLLSRVYDRDSSSLLEKQTPAVPSGFPPAGQCCLQHFAIRLRV